MDTGVGFINLDDSIKIALNIAQAVAVKMQMSIIPLRIY